MFLARDIVRGVMSKGLVGEGLDQDFYLIAGQT
jgi:hypothetical protein